MPLFSKILIANRGEIVLRVISTARKLGIGTVAIYSLSDKNAMHVRMADEACSLDTDDLTESYLNIPKILEIAVRTKCEAIHPGYGFLSENPKFAEACENSGIVFIGPRKDIIRLMGNKIEANRFVKNSGILTIDNRIGDMDFLMKEAVNMEFPILLKAAAGGGGKGMRIVNEKGQLAEALETTSREAKNYFGNETVYAEKYIENPRHIEVQVLGDNNGNVVHLFERECSIQRRYQKIIEEAPSVTLNEELRAKICDAAIEIAKKANYTNAGTIEFLVDKNLNFYFLEMNTRIQVEHPVTEMITGIDIVEQQLRIAAGLELTISQEDIRKNGHAIECRIYAERPDENFMPSPGKVNYYKATVRENKRLETALETNSRVFSFYDPMIAKLVVWGVNRKKAILSMRESLDDFVVHGLETNVEFLKELIRNEDYIQNEISTNYCDKNLNKLIDSINKKNEFNDITVPLAGFLLYDLKRSNASSLRQNTLWTEIGYWRHFMLLSVLCNNKEFRIDLTIKNQNDYAFVIDSRTVNCHLIQMTDNEIVYSIADQQYTCHISYDESNLASVSMDGKIYRLRRKNCLIEKNAGQISNQHISPNDLTSPMPGKVLKINVKEGDAVKKDNTLLVIESMKMEINIYSGKEAKVLKINVKEGDLVESGVVLVQLTEGI